MNPLTLSRATDRRAIITWGRHPAHGNTWIKLHRYSRARNDARLREGWELVFRRKGESV